MRLLSFGLLLLVCLSSCSSKPSAAEARERLKAQAKEVGEAMLKPDHEKMVSLSHPKLIEMMGGKEKFVRTTERMDREAREQGFGSKGMSWSEPSEVIESSGDLYATVPYVLEMTGPGKALGTQPSFLIAVSTDGGTNWKFLDGGGFNGDRKKLIQVLPNFPSSIPLPARAQADWKY